MNQEKIEQILKAAAPVAAILAGIVTLAVIAYACFSVGHLFIEYVKLSTIESALAVLSSVGMAVGLLLVIVTTDNQNARGLGAILVIAWVMLVLTMVALDSVLRADLVSAPDALLQIGRITAALLPALALAGVICMSIALHDTTEHKSAAGASSRYIGFAAKGVAIAASVFASAYFGIQRGINPVLAALCGVLLESAFLWSYLSLKQSRDRQDRFDVGMWAFCTLAFGAFIAAVSVETLSTLGGIDVPVVSMLGEIGATLYVSAVGLSLTLTVLVHLFTRAIDMPAKAAQDTINVRRPAPLSTRIAGGIRNTRAGVGEIREAWREGAPAQLPNGTVATLAAERPFGNEGVKGDSMLWRRPDGLIRKARSTPDGWKWSVERDGETVASGTADSISSAEAAANTAGAEVTTRTPKSESAPERTGSPAGRTKRP